jgi:choline dehydrogenase
MGPLDRAWGATLTNLGLGVNGQDPRAGATLGGYSVLKSMDGNARRSTSARGYYSSIANTSNLTVLTNVHVNKILFAPSGLPLVATGASYTVDGNEYFVDAKREVIVCAGSVNSPQILELSGIGAKDILDKVGVNVLVSNPQVGENLQVSLHFLLHCTCESSDE